MRGSVFIVLTLIALWNAIAGYAPSWRLKDRGTLDPNGTASPSTSVSETGDDRGTLDPNG